MALTVPLFFVWLVLGPALLIATLWWLPRWDRDADAPWFACAAIAAVPGAWLYVEQWVRWGAHRWLGIGQRSVPVYDLAGTGLTFLTIPIVPFLLVASWLLLQRRNPRVVNDAMAARAKRSMIMLVAYTTWVLLSAWTSLMFAVQV